MSMQNASRCPWAASPCPSRRAAWPSRRTAPCSCAWATPSCWPRPARSKDAAAGRRLPAPDRRLPREHLRRGQDPRRLLQARGPAEREGDPDLAHDRPAAAAALPRGLRLRDPGHRPAALGRHGERLRHAGHHRRLHRARASPTSRSRARWARCASATGTASASSTPPRPSCRTKSRLNLLVAGTEDAIVMVESGAQELTEEEMVRALQEGHEAIKQIVAMQKDLRAARGQAEARRSRRSAGRCRLRGLGRSTRSASPLLEAMRTPGKLESYAQMKEVRDDFVAAHPRGPSPRSARPCRGIYDALREKIMRSEILGQRPPPRRPPLRRDPRHHARGGRAAAHARLRAVHARRDAGPGHRHPRHLRGHADHRHRAGAASTRSASCCTTTSRPSRWAR